MERAGRRTYGRPMAKTLSTSSDLVRDAEHDEESNTLRATVEGEINLHNSPALRSDLLSLAEHTTPDVVELDLAGVPYMDSSAIAVLVELLKAVRKHKGTVRLRELQPRVKGLLQIARLDSIFDLSDGNSE